MHAQQAWFVVDSMSNIPTLPIVAPYIAIKTEPIGFNLMDVSSNANSVINSGISVIIPLFKSPVFNHGIVPFS